MYPRGSRFWRKITFACVLSMAMWPARADELTWPDSIAATRAKAFLEALNGDDEAARRFYQTHRSPEALKERPLEVRLAQLAEMRTQVGRLEAVKVTQDDERNIRVVAKGSGGSIEYISIRIELEKDPPHLVAKATMQPSGPPSDADVDLKKLTTLDELAEATRKASGAPGLSLAVVRDGKLAAPAVAGVREAGGQDKVQPDDRFHIGSVTKSFTACVVAKLIEDGKLKWDTPISAALPDITTRPEYANVTMEQLMQHRGGIRAYTAGIEDSFKGSLAPNTSPVEARRAFAKRVLNAEPLNTPGSAMAYSNAGYAVLAAVAEQASGRSWEDLLQAVVFGPLEMKTAGVGWPAGPSQADEPRGHFGSGAAMVVQRDGVYDIGPYIGPAGDVHCSMSDLAKYAAAHLRGLRGEDGFLKAETIRRLHTPPPGGDYACGWGVRQSDGVHWHNGSAGTFYCMTEIWPAENFACVVAVNCGLHAEPAVGELVAECSRRARVATAP
jgi:CubicO group peptidase (beta-lactamase class C family)